MQHVRRLLTTIIKRIIVLRNSYFYIIFTIHILDFLSIQLLSMINRNVRFTDFLYVLQEIKLRVIELYNVILLYFIIFYYDVQNSDLMRCSIKVCLSVRLNDHTKEIINGTSTLLEVVIDKAIEWPGQKCIRSVHNEPHGNLRDRLLISILKGRGNISPHQTKAVTRSSWHQEDRIFRVGSPVALRPGEWTAHDSTKVCRYCITIIQSREVSSHMCRLYLSLSCRSGNLELFQRNNSRVFNTFLCFFAYIATRSTYTRCFYCRCTITNARCAVVQVFQETSAITKKRLNSRGRLRYRAAE